MSAGREPVPFDVYAVGVYLHGTKADLAVGELLVSGRESNFEADRVMNYVYFTATLDAAVWGAELASGEGRGRIYIVEPTGEFEDDPNLTDKRFPGNPTQSFRSREPLRLLASWSIGSVIRPTSLTPCEPRSLHCSRTKRRGSRTKSPQSPRGRPCACRCARGWPGRPSGRERWPTAARGVVGLGCGVVTVVGPASRSSVRRRSGCSGDSIASPRGADPPPAWPRRPLGFSAWGV